MTADRDEAILQLARVAADSVPSAGPYRLQEDALDPGWILLRSLVGSMADQLDSAREGSALRAVDRLYELVELPQPGRPALAFVHWDGPQGTRIEAGLALVDAAGAHVADTSDETTLTQPESVCGITPGAAEVDLTSQLLEGKDAAAAPVAELIGVRVRLRPGDADGALPGLLWDVPAILSRRLGAVRVAGAPLLWERDEAGRVFVPPQEAGPGDVTFELPLEPGAARFCGRLFVNVTTAVACEPGHPLDANRLRQTLEGHDELRLTQPFAGHGEVLAESVAEWRQRIAARLRHRGAAVTRQDYEDIAAELCPQLRLLDVSPTRVRVGSTFADAVRLTIAPRHWASPFELLDRAVRLAEEIERIFADRVPLGLRVVAGPPVLRLKSEPACDRPLWLHRDSVVTGPALSVCRGGVHWPVMTLAELEGTAL